MSVKRYAALFLTTVILLLCSALPVFAETGVQYVFDNANIIEPEDEARINSEAAKAAENIPIYVVFTVEYYEGTDFLSDRGLSSSDDLCVIVISYDNGSYFLDVYTYGNAYSRITDGEIDDLLHSDAVYNNIKRIGDPVAGAIACIGLMSDAYLIPWGTIIIVALIIGAVVGAITVGSVVGKYKMKMRPTNYPLDKYAKLNVTGGEDTFIGKHVAVVVRQSSSSGGGGGGSSHGGGGGHRGGI